MGTHPSGQAILAGEGQNYEIAGKTLASILQDVPEYAGSIEVLKEFGVNGKDLPFLFKVLSIGQPLSIQSHPDKELAKKLHAADPKNYPDDNHKPEMAIALTPMEALCSFRTQDQLLEIFSLFPEIKLIANEVTVNEFTSAKSKEEQKQKLRECLSNILKADQSTVSKTLLDLHSKFSSKQFDVTSSLANELCQLFLKVYNFYPTDVGCIVAFLLNFVRLEPGQAIFLKANEPHAYLSGDCIECMAKSDNVIRAGFTPKFKDVQQLYSSLSYESKKLSDLMIHPVLAVDGFTSTYLTGIENSIREFRVDKIHFDSDGALSKEFVFPARPGGSILIVIKGMFRVKDGFNVKAESGCVYFIPAMLPLTVVSIQSQLLCFRAFANFRDGP